MIKTSHRLSTTTTTTAITTTATTFNESSLSFVSSVMTRTTKSDHAEKKTTVDMRAEVSV